MVRATRPVPIAQTSLLAQCSSPTSIRLLGSDDFPSATKERATLDLTSAAREAALSIPIAEPVPLDRIAEARDRVDGGTRQRVLVAIPS